MIHRSPSPRRRVAGAVATLWLVVVVILWLATVGLWYLATRGVAEAEQRADTQKTAMADLKSERDAAVEGYAALSAVVGYGGGAGEAKSDPGAIQIELDAVRGELADSVAPDAKLTLQDAMAALRTAASGHKQAFDTAQADLKSAVEARQLAETNGNTLEGTFTGQVDELTQQLADANQRADNQSQADMKRIDEVMAAQSASDAAAREAQQSLAEFQVKSRRDLNLVEAQLKAVAIRREPRAPEAPDGKLLSVGAGGTIGFIDIGRRSGLHRGTRFEVLRTGASGDLVPAGMVEVRELQDTIAMVGLLGEPNPLDPILPGDQVRNPHFDKMRVMHHYLLGEFPLTLSKDFVSARLAELGAAVDETLSTSTDVLVLGEKPLGEADAKELTETDEYKLADKLGMRIIRLADLADFLRYN